MWSEQTKAPRGGFGDRVSAAAGGGAGMTSDKIAMRAKEIKFEARSGSPVGPRLKPTTDGTGDAAVFDGAAGLTSSKICEIGPGMVNKYDLTNSAKKGGSSPRPLRKKCASWSAHLDEVHPVYDLTHPSRSWLQRSMCTATCTWAFVWSGFLLLMLVLSLLLRWLS